MGGEDIQKCAGLKTGRAVHDVRLLVERVTWANDIGFVADGDKYAKGKNGFNLKLEALSSGNKLKSTVRYGASYFFDFVLNRSSLVKLEFGVDYVKKDTKVALDPALAVKDIAETRLSGGLRYYF